MYTVIVKRKIIRNLQKLPLNVQQMFVRLRNDLETSGPVQTAWPNYSLEATTTAILDITMWRAGNVQMNP